jgi:hypothetical protein
METYKTFALPRPTYSLAEDFCHLAHVFSQIRSQMLSQHILDMGVTKNRRVWKKRIVPPFTMRLHVLSFWSPLLIMVGHRFISILIHAITPLFPASLSLPSPRRPESVMKIYRIASLTDLAHWLQKIGIWWRIALLRFERIAIQLGLGSVNIVRSRLYLARLFVVVIHQRQE